MNSDNRNCLVLAKSLKEFLLKKIVDKKIKLEIMINGNLLLSRFIKIKETSPNIE